MLAKDGSIGAYFSVAVGDELEISDGNEISIEELVEIVDDEIRAVGAERFVVYLEADFVGGVRNSSNS